MLYICLGFHIFSLLSRNHSPSLVAAFFILIFVVHSQSTLFFVLKEFRRYICFVPLFLVNFVT